MNRKITYFNLDHLNKLSILYYNCYNTIPKLRNAVKKLIFNYYFAICIESLKYGIKIFQLTDT